MRRTSCVARRRRARTSRSLLTGSATGGQPQGWPPAVWGDATIFPPPCYFARENQGGSSMTPTRILGALVLLGALAAPAFADDITEAIDQARKAYQSGDLSN